MSTTFQPSSISESDEKNVELRPAFVPCASPIHGAVDSSLRATVIVASIDARATIQASLTAFLREVRDQGEVILVDASRDGTADEVARQFPSVLVLRRPAGWLAPELWREGLLEARTPLIAFSTAQMVPSEGWLDSHRMCLAKGGTAVAGGPIVASGRLSGGDRAVYLLRYVNYGPPLGGGQAFEPPGDNALYRRDLLLEIPETWKDGFWEVEVHRGLRAQGHQLGVAGEATVEFRGGASLWGMLRQRRLHARHYGAARARRMSGLQRAARSLAAPLVPAVLLRRIHSALKARGRSFGPWVGALPTLLLLLAAWTTGETMGTWLGPPTLAKNKGLTEG